MSLTAAKQLASLDRAEAEKLIEFHEIEGGVLTGNLEQNPMACQSMKTYPDGVIDVEPTQST